LHGRAVRIVLKSYIETPRAIRQPLVPLLFAIDCHDTRGIISAAIAGA
jgi:hypothetical protein